MNHGYKPNQTPGLFNLMPISHGNIKCAQEEYSQAMTPADVETDISQPS